MHGAQVAVYTVEYYFLLLFSPTLLTRHDAACVSCTRRSTVSCARESVVSCRGVPEPTTQSAPQWDSSCAVVKDTSHPADAQSTALAAELLKQAADLKSVHSVLSARAVLSRATSAMGARSQGHTKPHAHVHTHTAPPE